MESITFSLDGNRGASFDDFLIKCEPLGGWYRYWIKER
jgi:hypothetical protein